LLSEIFHQRGFLKALKLTKVIDDNQLGTVVGKYINGNTLKNMYLVEKVVKMDTDLKESNILSNLMDDFPPICKHDPIDVQTAYMYEHYKTTGDIIKYSDILDTMYGGSLPVATKKRKSKKKDASGAAEEEEASKPKSKKVKKEKGTLQEVGPAMPTIQEDFKDLEPVKVLNKRTRGGASSESSLSLSPQPTIHKKKRKHVVWKMKVSTYVTDEDAEVEVAIDIVTREVRKKKATDVDALQQALDISKEIEVPAEVLLKESTVEDAHKVVELAEDLQELVVADQGFQIEDIACLGVGTSEATRGNSDSHNISKNIVEVESTSTSTSTTFENLDDIPLSRVNENLHKALAPSPSVKH